MDEILLVFILYCWEWVGGGVFDFIFIEVRGRFYGVSFLFSFLYGFWGLDLGE